MLRVSVIIPHYNDLDGLARCLASLDAQTLSRNQFEVIVADNASPVERARLAALTDQRARLTIVSEKGAGPARNGGVALASGEVLAFIDADCVASPEWLEAGLAALKDYDVIGGRVDVLVSDRAQMSGAEAFESVFAFDFKTYILNKGFTGAGNMFVPRRVFDQVGGFRPAVSEDVEWSLRATGMGFRLGYAPDAIIAHPARRNWVELVGKWRRMSRETYLLTRERRFGRLRWLARTWATPPSALVHTPKVLAHPSLPDVRARWRALATLYRLRAWRFLDGHRLLFRNDDIR